MSNVTLDSMSASILVIESSIQALKDRIDDLQSKTSTESAKSSTLPMPTKAPLKAILECNVYVCVVLPLSKDIIVVAAVDSTQPETVEKAYDATRARYGHLDIKRLDYTTLLCCLQGGYTISKEQLPRV